MRRREKRDLRNLHLSPYYVEGPIISIYENFGEDAELKTIILKIVKSQHDKAKIFGKLFFNILT